MSPASIRDAEAPIKVREQPRRADQQRPHILEERWLAAFEDVTDELAAYKLALLPFPGVFGVFYETDRPTKNALEKKWIETTREKTGNASDLEILQKTFDRIK